MNGATCAELQKCSISATFSGMVDGSERQAALNGDQHSSAHKVLMPQVFGFRELLRMTTAGNLRQDKQKGTSLPSKVTNTNDYLLEQ